MLHKRLAWLALAVVLGCQATGAEAGTAPAQETSLSVTTDPPGATVRVNRHERSWTSPCEVGESFLKRGAQEVVITLEGYEPVYRTVPTERRKPAHLDVKLTARSGAVHLDGAVPGSTVLLLQVLSEVKDIGTILRLWSENEATLLSALEKLPDEEAPLVAARLKELEAAPQEKVAAAAKARAARAGAPRPGIDVAFRAIADIRGAARFPKVPVNQAYHLLATRPGSPDFAMANIKTDWRAPAAVRVPPPAAKAADPAKLPPPPPPLAAESAPAGPARLRLKGSGSTIRVSSGDKVLAEISAKGDEPVDVTVPAGRYRVEFLNAATGAVTHSVEAGAPAAAPDVPRESERIGRIQLVHRVYGVFVRLEAGLELLPGEDVVIYREGIEVSRGKIIQVCAGDETYPDGAAQVTREGAAIREGDEARRFK